MFVKLKNVVLVIKFITSLLLYRFFKFILTNLEFFLCLLFVVVVVVVVVCLFFCCCCCCPFFLECAHIISKLFIA